ncbi:hypothetical protein KJ758_02085 [Patescibacteria group bacterium]|nr:hypothetical protein [Patescibacteria group bacterium]
MTKEKDTSVNYFKIFLIILAAIAAGFIFIILLLIIALAIIKPFGVNVLKAPALILGPSSETESTYDHPLLSTEQEVMLESIGIDTTSIPTEITAAQQQCAVDALGEERATQIIDGSAPTVSDLLKAQNCF